MIEWSTKSSVPMANIISPDNQCSSRLLSARRCTGLARLPSRAQAEASFFHINPDGTGQQVDCLLFSLWFVAAHWINECRERAVTRFKRDLGVVCHSTQLLSNYFLQQYLTATNKGGEKTTENHSENASNQSAVCSWNIRMITIEIHRRETINMLIMHWHWAHSYSRDSLDWSRHYYSYCSY